jgi:hypothetical protein
MYLLVVVLMFSGGQYEEFVSPAKSQAECEAHLPEIREAAEQRLTRDKRVVGYTMTCNPVKGREV